MTNDEQIALLIPKLKEKAERIRSAEKLDTVEDMLLRVRMWFAEFYKIPMYSQAIEEYPIDKMIFEFFLMNWEPQAPITSKEAKEQLINENREELGALFDDMDEPKTTLGQALSKEENDFMNKVFPDFNLDEKDLANGSSRK
jgi:hypothetical protein